MAKKKSAKRLHYTAMMSIKTGKVNGVGKHPSKEAVKKTQDLVKKHSLVLSISKKNYHQLENVLALD